MAKTTITILTCDRCKAETGKNIDEAESVAFGYEGFLYALDLCTAHAESFHGNIQGLISWSSDRTRVAAGRRLSRPDADVTASGLGAGTTARRSLVDRERLKAIREWARKNGYPDLSDHGRIPHRIIAAYDAAE